MYEKEIVTITPLIVLCFALVGCNQQERIKAPKEIQSETPQTEHIEIKTFTVEERQSEDNFATICYFD